MTDESCSLALTPAEWRLRFRQGSLVRPTAGLAPGFVQANLVVLPRALAFDFLLFAQRNPKSCPLLEVVDAGATEPKEMAPGADLRTDVPLYRVYRDGVLAEEPGDLVSLWARRPGVVPDRLQLHVRVGARRGRHPGAARRAVHERADVHHVGADRSGGRVPRPDGRVDAARSRREGGTGGAGHVAVSRRSTARRSTSATRRPSASATSRGPTSATRSRSVRARCRCSGRAA